MYGERKLLAKLRRHSVAARCCEVLIRDRVQIARAAAPQECPHRRRTVTLRLIEYKHWQEVQKILVECKAVAVLRGHAQYAEPGDHE